MLSVVTLEPHSESPVHLHANEQWGVCLEGEWIRIQDGVEHHVKAGDFWQTPPHVPHGGRTLRRALRGARYLRAAAGGISPGWQRARGRHARGPAVTR